MDKTLHYSIKEATKIIENNTATLSKEAYKIAKAIDNLYFEQLKGLIKALKILKKGKRG